MKIPWKKIGHVAVVVALYALDHPEKVKAVVDAVHAKKCE